MPAVGERVYIIPEQSGQAAWIMEFPTWWERREFFETYGSRQIDSGNPVYVDYGLLITGGEARAWDQQCRERFTQDVRSQAPFFVEALEHWKSLLDRASWVVVEMVEWESGLS